MTERKTSAEADRGEVAPASGQTPPWGPLTSLRREMERLFDEFGTSRWPVPGAMRLMSEVPPIPALDLVEADGGYEMTAELPGIDAKDVELKVTGDLLTLRGEKRETRERKEADRHVSERRYGSFQRTLRLPPDADAEGISASSAHGVLTVRIPKSESARAKEKKIEISGG